MRLRDWPIWLKLVALLLIPILSAVALWLSALNTAIQTSRESNAVQGLWNGVGAGILTLGSSVQTEELDTATFISTGHQSGGQQMDAARAATDATIAQFRQVSAAANLPNENGLLRSNLGTIAAALNRLPAIRQAVDSSTLKETLDAYEGVLTLAYETSTAIVPLLQEPNLVVDFDAFPSISTAQAALGEEHAFLAGVLANGTFTTGQYADFAQLVGQRQTTLALAADQLSVDNPGVASPVNDPANVQLTAVEQSVLSSSADGTTLPVSAATWTSVTQAGGQQLSGLTQRVFVPGLQQAADHANALESQARLILVLGLIALVLILIVSFFLARSLVRRLTRLRRAALELADEQLPDVVRRLQAGETVDVAAEVPPITGLGKDEIGALTNAFNNARTTAVGVAVQQAALREGVSRMFLNLARRSQALVHRQLKLIDSMERREVEPDDLQDLFQLDHLATRMRRHAEDLIVLSGSAPGRGWRNPVPLRDVVRGAVAEVENYAQATVKDLPELSVVGPAVGDLIHLLAELIENATSFSPPDAPVNIGGHVVANGVAVEIEDGGLGIAEEDLVELNRRLVEPPPFDPVNSERLGLFVVARLALRHGIDVRLRRSVYGGTTAIVLLPNVLLAGAGQATPAAGRDEDDQEARRELVWRGWFNETQRHGVPADAEAVREDIGAAEATVRVEAGPWNDRRPRGARHVIEETRAQLTPGSDAGAVDTRAADTRAADTRAVDTRAVDTRAVGTGPSRIGRQGGWSSPGAPSTSNEGLDVRVRSRSDGRRTSVSSVPGPSSSRNGGRSQRTASGQERTDVGLPRRVRQANLVPELRDTAAGGAAGAVDDEPTSRSPEEIRSMMASYQLGSRRARIETPRQYDPGSDEDSTQGAPAVFPQRRFLPEIAGDPMSGPTGFNGGTSGMEDM